MVAAIIERGDRRLLIGQRRRNDTSPLKWEFPGGKVEVDERPEAALIRELHEELGIAVEETCLAPLTFASFAYPDFHLLMPLYICRRWTGFVVPRENQTLKWVQPQDLRTYPMPPADTPLIPALLDLLV